MRPIRTFLKTWNEANSASIRAKDAKKKMAPYPDSSLWLCRIESLFK